MEAKELPSPYIPITMGAGDNPNTVDLTISYAYSDNPENKGVPFILFQYELTAEEIARVQKDGYLRIAIMGTQMAPILPFVETPAEIGFYAAEISDGRLVDPRRPK